MNRAVPFAFQHAEDGDVAISLIIEIFDRPCQRFLQRLDSANGFTPIEFERSEVGWRQDFVGLFQCPNMFCGPSVMGFV